MLVDQLPSATTHEYIKHKWGWQCQHCYHFVMCKQRSTCPGLPVYDGYRVALSAGLRTKSSLRKRGLKPAPDQPAVGVLRQQRRHCYHLYDVDGAVPVRPMSDAQKAALAKAQYMSERLQVECSRCGDPQWRNDSAWRVTRKRWLEQEYDAWLCRHCKARDRATEWAMGVLADDNAVILDTETTGLDRRAEIIEVAVIDMDGQTLFNQRIRPQNGVPAEASAIHGITTDDLADEPTFADVYPALCRVLSGRKVLIYNADYDRRLLRQDCERHGLAAISFDAACVMERYAAFVGNWSTYHESYQWQPLGGDHSALGDCLATRAVVYEMAARV